MYRKYAITAHGADGLVTKVDETSANRSPNILHLPRERPLGGGACFSATPGAAPRKCVDAYYLQRTRFERSPNERSDGGS
jgi:hypothetical protein